jgi:paraquat-inducible protein A
MQQALSHWTSAVAPADDEPIVACHECGLVHRVPAIPPGTVARCARCGATLYAHHHAGLDGVLAYYAGALVLFLIANSATFMTLRLEGRADPTDLWSGAVAFWRVGMEEVAIAVLAFAIVMPGLKILSALWVLVPYRLGRRPFWARQVIRLVDLLHPWAMMEVYLLGAIVAYVKIKDLAQVEVGTALWAFAGAIMLMSAGSAALDELDLWTRVRPQATARLLQPRPGTLLMSCHICGQLARVAEADHHARCPRCTSRLHHRRPDSVARTWALLVTAVILYIPANLYPVMTIVYLGRGDPQTILGGVSYLLHEGMWPLAALIFFASVLVPVLKMLALAILLLSVQRRTVERTRDRTVLYRLVESIGRWSMVDVFVVAILVAMVNLGAIATIEAGPGIIAFCGVVIVTMLAAMAFDPRLIWDARDARDAGPQAATA